MNVIEVYNIIKRYGGRLAVDGVSFTVEEGEIFGILGPERRRQDHDRRVHRRPAHPRRGHDQSARVSIRDTTARSSASRSASSSRRASCPTSIRVGEALDLYASFYDHPADWRAARSTTSASPTS